MKPVLKKNVKRERGILVVANVLWFRLKRGIISECFADIAAFIPLCENMCSGTATRPGDVVTARNGKTIQVT